VAIDNGTNAGLLAAQILGTGDPELRERLKAHRDTLEKQVMAKVDRVTRSG
jgi:phosphoribosylcarboxyaminoimidazole (NCAIR) mutase